MQPLIDELKRNPSFAAYLIVGVIIALFFMRQEKMLESATQSKFMIGLSLFLAFIWPLLLLVMLLNYFQGDYRSKSPKVSDDKQLGQKTQLPDSAIPTKAYDVAGKSDSSQHNHFPDA